MIGDKKFDFIFYLLILLECFSTSLIKIHLFLFRPNKIKGIGDISDKKKLKLITNILNSIAKNPEEKIRVDKEEDRQKATEIFYSIYLYFNLHFQNDKVLEMFKDEKSFNFLFEKLNSFNSLFDYLILPKEYILKLIDKANDYDQILNFLSFLGKDCLLFFEVMNEKKDKILQLFNEKIKKIKEKKENEKDNKGKNKEKIEIENYVEPKKEDNIKLILQEIIKIKSINLEQSFLQFSSSFLEKYVDIFNETNLDNLIMLKYIIEIVQQIDKTFKFDYDMDKLIHENGLIFIQKGKLKNKELLDFITKDEYYQNQKYDKKIYRILDIFDGIDILLLNEETIKEEFFNNWERMNFDKMFDSQFYEFIEKIGSLIKEMKDFGLLFSFFNIDKEPKTQCIIKLQKKYNELIQTYEVETCPNFIEQTIKLIYLSDFKNINLEMFLSEVINDKFDVKTVNNIYIKLIDKYPKLSKQCKNKIIKFFTKNNQNSNPSTLLYLIKECPNLRDDIFFNRDNYII